MPPRCPSDAEPVTETALTAAPPDRIGHLRIERDDNAFSGLTEDQRLRLIVRVLCELVAYDGTPPPAAVDPHADLAPVPGDALTTRLVS